MAKKAKGHIGAIHRAKENGQIVPLDGRRVLRDGTLITNIVLSRRQGEGLVEGLRPDGTPFSIIRSLASFDL